MKKYIFNKKILLIIAVFLIFTFIVIQLNSLYRVNEEYDNFNYCNNYYNNLRPDDTFAYDPIYFDQLSLLTLDKLKILDPNFDSSVNPTNLTYNILNTSNSIFFNNLIEKNIETSNSYFLFHRIKIRYILLRKYNPDEIFVLALNSVVFEDGTCGFQTKANVDYDKDLDELDSSELEIIFDEILLNY